MAIMSPSEIGELVRQIRKMHRLTQAQLAELAGVGRRFVVDIEAGHDRAEFRKVGAVMRALGLEVYDEPDPFTAVPTPSGLVSFRTVTSRTGRPLAVPNRLWTLEPARATAELVLPHSVSWSDGGGTFDMSDLRDRQLAYRILMLEATPAVMVEFMDGGLLADMWDEFMVPAEVRGPWAPAVAEYRSKQAA